MYTWLYSIESSANGFDVYCRRADSWVSVLQYTFPTKEAAQAYIDAK